MLTKEQIARLRKLFAAGRKVRQEMREGPKSWDELIKKQQEVKKNKKQ